VYCTCTLLSAENEDVVQSVLRESGEAVELDDLREDLPVGLAQATGAGYLLTPDLFGTDGFFMARLRKVR
jgi:16S rRNA (cytosine967-C5)-methyltransferase